MRVPTKLLTLFLTHLFVKMATPLLVHRHPVEEVSTAALPLLDRHPRTRTMRRTTCSSTPPLPLKDRS